MVGAEELSKEVSGLQHICDAPFRARVRARAFCRNGWDGMEWEWEGE